MHDAKLNETTNYSTVKAVKGLQPFEAAKSADHRVIKEHQGVTPGLHVSGLPRAADEAVAACNLELDSLRCLGLISGPVYLISRVSRKIDVVAAKKKIAMKRRCS
jgi:hypothetical protein